MISFKNRFHGHGSLRYVYNNGRTVRSRIAVIKSIKNPHRKNSRAAVVISKKVLKSAVGRNRIRRRVYEIIRHRLPQIKGTYDIVVIVSSAELRDMQPREIYEQLGKLFDQAGL